MCERLSDGDCLTLAFDTNGHAEADLLEHVEVTSSDSGATAVIQCLACPEIMAGVERAADGGYDLKVELSRTALRS